ncbi:hypothetical protein BBP40_001323 [Aspergillus hancockii]|nr:hypothetical protein BBP40_001323 [Aspergillus hancockii]
MLVEELNGRVKAGGLVEEAEPHLISGPVVSPLPDQELDQIWQWNSSVPDQIPGCVHELIAEITELQPDTLAVSAWDGDLTYSQLHSLSNEVATRLIGLGLVSGSNISLLFQKSRWTCVAMLGVIKAGCAAIALDHNQPDSRLSSIIQQAQPMMIISSPIHHDRAQSLAGVPVLVLGEELMDVLNRPNDSGYELPVVSHRDTVYISFTSGTTGHPKGACISHANVRSAVFYQGEKLGFHRHSRVFDFAPYSFDVAWSNFLHTLCAGGCICIVREEDMINDLSTAITASKATLINVTPTVLRIIDPIPETLETVLLSGEMPFPDNITQWAGRVRLLNTYGPTECTFKCAFSVLDSSCEGRPDIGAGVGFCTWIVDPEASETLASIGSVGELYLEGPLVGQGYISDAKKTEEAFIEDPAWLITGSAKITGRRGKLYKTGDLVKYKPDGKLLFVGRRDQSQHKIRGQRVEIGDVEYHVRGSLPDEVPTIVDAVRLPGSDSASLILFVEAKEQEREDVKVIMDGLPEKLSEILPTFMIPTVYLPVDKIPIASTGKVDRRRLRETFYTLTGEEIAKLQATIFSDVEHCEPSNEAESKLRHLWARVLNREPVNISTADNFLRLGGDSIAAMYMVAAARGDGLSVTVRDVFRSPTLHDLAQAIHFNGTSLEDRIIPFSLLQKVKDRYKTCEAAAALCGVLSTEIEDMYPCTPLQEGMIALTAKAEPMSNDRYGTSAYSTNYIVRRLFELPRGLRFGQLRKAWERVVERTPILRTRIVSLPEEGLIQVVLSPSISWKLNLYPDIYEFMQNAGQWGLGKPLCRAGLLEKDCNFMLEMHHCIFDGWSTMLVLDALEAAYHESDDMEYTLTPFQPFVNYIMNINTEESTAFWRSYLEGSEATTFPSPNYEPREKVDLNHHVSGLRWPQTGITASSIVHSTLAILLASYTNCDDVKYGATVSGRQAAVLGIERMAGPTVATIPVRMKLNWSQTVDSLLQQVQHEIVKAGDHEQFGLQQIRRIGEDIAEASQFQLLLVVQPAHHGVSQKPGGLFSRAKSVLIGPNSIGDFSDLVMVTKDGLEDSTGMYNSYAVMMICELEETGITLKINFDSGAIDSREVERIAMQFEVILRQLCRKELACSNLCDLNFLTIGDLSYIWHWNRSLPKPPVLSVTQAIDTQAAFQPETIAISASDNQVTYKELQDLSTNLASGLQEQGATSGSIVVLSFEKSSWLLTSMLAVLKIGAVALPMSAFVSDERANQIVQKLQPKLCITSAEAGSSPFQALLPTFHISDLILPRDTTKVHAFHSWSNLLSAPALIIFTSGSTGTPKAILWSHETLSGNIHAACSSFGLTQASKVFQFAGYEFDVSTVESLATLAVGGCLFIPSESDRTNRLAGAINDSNANWICLTPSVAGTLVPAEFPSLNTLVFAGEKLEHKTAIRWTERLDSVYNWYGPAEASVATSYYVDMKTWKPGIIGKGSYSVTWLVDPKDPHNLAPIGSVAELCIEGSILARYSGDDGLELNQEAFISPEWLYRGHGDIPGRPGPIYKTGDLVRYNSDGTIVFIGRKLETQRKLRGHRIDLLEVEYRAQTFLSGRLDVAVVAELISPLNNVHEILALFVCPLDFESRSDVEDFLKVSLPVDELETQLLRSLPSYMVPKVYVPLGDIPLSHSGKTDRRRLRQLGSSFTMGQLADMQPTRRITSNPSTQMETILQGFWAEVLGTDKDSIYTNDNFFRLGGDSISAMRLVALAYDHGLQLSVADIFNAPELESMARAIRQETKRLHDEVPPFSLLPGPATGDGHHRSYAARICCVLESQIIDVYPCTPLQEGLLALGVRRHGRYVSRSVLEIQETIDLNQLQTAWRATVRKLPILRTRIIDMPGQGLVQVVLDEIPWRTARDIESYLREDEQEAMNLGSQLCRATIIDRSFILTIHHCTYDGHSLKMILNELEDQYFNKVGAEITPFTKFIQYVHTIDSEVAASFWKKELSNSELRQFPVLPWPTYAPQANEHLEHPIVLEWPRSGITSSTILRSAWAILAAQYVASRHVIFGAVSSGRQAAVQGVERCVAPTIATVPVAISVNWDERIDAFLARIQRHVIVSTPYEQFGLQNIQRTVGSLESSLFQTLLVVQPIIDGKSLNKDGLLFKARSFGSTIETQGTDPFNANALLLMCQLTVSGLQLQMSFDNNVIDKRQAHRLACQFESILRQLCTASHGSKKLEALQTASDNDIESFWTSNMEVPEEPNTFVHDMITSAAKRQPDAVAIDAWDGRFLYREVEELSTTLARSLIDHGVSKGSTIALSFEKSKWTPIAQLAVFKAGAVTLLQSVAVPEHRVSTVFKKLGVQIALGSQPRIKLISQYARCFTIDELLGPPLEPYAVLLPALDWNDPAAIIVSSGSTGEPKQILWSHKNFAVHVRSTGDLSSLSPSSRVFQFVSYDFDASNYEMLATLAYMGCLCIPSEFERMNAVGEAVNRFSANYVFMTPSTAKLLTPEDVPSITTLCVGGENSIKEDIDRWKGRCQVINFYGPAEFCNATVTLAHLDTWHSGVIGHISSKNPGCVWLVDPNNYNRLVPFGAVGEIALEGPPMAECYMSNATLTDERFLKDPDFLHAVKTPGIIGRQGRVYRTGDLARYDTNGYLIYLGRKDTQLKVRGQLVAPEEVEQNIKRLLTNGSDIDVAVVSILPDGTRLPTLVAFVVTETEVTELTKGLNDRLKSILPVFAIPTYYIPISRMPTGPTGKRDFARLREIGASFDPSKQINNSERRDPVTMAEKQLCELWSLVLPRRSEEISLDDNFLYFGNSIEAMRLAGVARQHGFSLTVANVFEHPTLEGMAKVLEDLEDTTEEKISPFTLLDADQDIALVRRQAASLCDVSEDDIEDLFPCIQLQEGLLALSTKRQGDYTSCEVLELCQSVDPLRFTRAWERVVEMVPILRTRIVDLPGCGLVQAVVRVHNPWTNANSVEAYLAEEKQAPVGLGTPLMRCALFPRLSLTEADECVPDWKCPMKLENLQASTPRRPLCFALTMHHSIYDGLTMSLLIELLESFYEDKYPLNPYPFQAFVKYFSEINREKEGQYWKQQFVGLEAVQFPALPSSTYQPQTNSIVTYFISNLSWRADSFTPTTVIRATLGLLCAQYTSSFDVVFGTVVDGRKAPVQGIERIAGPTIATVPIRINMNSDETIQELLSTLQRQGIDMIPYEQTGLSRIRQVSEEGQLACSFQTLLVIQQPEQAMKDTGLFVLDDRPETGESRYRSFNSYSLSIICTPCDNGLKVQLAFDSTVTDYSTAQMMTRHFEQILRALCCQEHDDAAIGDISMVTDREIGQIWKWNSRAYKSVDRCMHGMIAEVVASQPDAIAISAWDGEVTYAVLDQLSTIIACRLVQRGVRRNMLIPLCFDKSMYAVIAFLGVIKACGAGILLDPNLPESRLRAMLDQVNPHLMLSSTQHAALAAKLVKTTLVVGNDSDLLRDYTGDDVRLDSEALPQVDPADLMYAIFTSGSTGTPKGCLIEHRHFCSAVSLQRTTLALSSTSRIEAERKSDLTNSISSFRATDIFLTPTTARVVEPTELSTLKNIYIGGEAVTMDDIARWVPYTNTFIVYGPTECSAISLYHQVSNPLSSRPSLGHGKGVNTWIVDPESTRRLAPLGTVGELYLEGPLVGRGYLHDEVKTNSSFIEDPPWLLQGSPQGDVPGRRGRLYKTGDLVRYDLCDGTISFIERKDTQVKLRGQRIELSEVEYHVQQCLLGNSIALPPPVAEVIVPRATGRQVLVVFLQLESNRLEELVCQLEMDLSTRVPPYMVPGMYIPLETIPVTVSGKIDRRLLRDIGANLTLEEVQVALNGATVKPPTTQSESRLQTLWEAVLGVSKSNIYEDSNFLRLGGDSVSAMRLAALARREGISLTVQNILKRPRLSDMAEYMTDLHSDVSSSDDSIHPFSLLRSPKNKEATLRYISRQCDIKSSQIQDVFPCTGVQKSLLSMTAKSGSSYIANFLMRLREDVDIARFTGAWHEVSRRVAPILTYRVVDVPNEGLVQVHINEQLEWGTFGSVDACLKHNAENSMGLSTRLTRLAIVKNIKLGGHGCLLTQHHAIYDGQSLYLLLDEVSKAYSGVTSSSTIAPFQAFVKHVMSLDREQVRDFWSREFFESEVVPFPELPYRDYQPKADSTVQRNFPDFTWPSGEATPSTIIRAAWSIIAARYTDSSDVVFGAMVTGRQAPLTGIDRMIAPLINAVPVRVRVDFQKTVSDFLRELQNQSIAMIPYEHTELLDIRSINADTERGTRFNALLVVQPVGQSTFSGTPDGPYKPGCGIEPTRSALDDFNPNAVMVMCQLTANNGIRLEISFDSTIIATIQMERIASQFEHVLRQICDATTDTVGFVDMVSPQDLEELWRWNASLPNTIEECVHDIVRRTTERQPDAPAICSWDGHLTYAELDGLSSRLALHLVALGARPGCIIPLCFEKSMWYSVAVLGVMKSGAACVAMDSTQPESRLRSIVAQVGPRLVLSSAANKTLASQLSGATVIVVDREYINTITTANSSKFLPHVRSSDVLYVVFTSGSTGVPKGVVTTHQNFASAATHQEEILHIRAGTRVFDFVSYNFDVSWSNTLQTLICGGCLCIPSECERKNDIPGAFNKMECDYVYFTPSVARSLEPSTMLGIKTLAMGGEPIQSIDAGRWTQADTIIGIYGPAECAQALSFVRLSANSRNNHVGHSYGARTWLVQPNCPDRLAAIGTIGELMIEGPTVSKEYFGEADRTAAVYIRDPEWLLKGSPGHIGRHGTVYKTGDLLRYNSDGSLDFIGRKDTMIKLRGQRIELEEIESHVRGCLLVPNLCERIAAEIIKPQNSNSPILALFVCLANKHVFESLDNTRSELMQVMEGLEERLADRLPQYMLPSAYIPIKEIPMTTTNKTDRRALREIGNTHTLERLAEIHSSSKERRAPSTIKEKQLQLLWSSVLEIKPESISADSSFLRIGGESIAAMRLVSAARDQGLSLSVADIFRCPRLCELAQLATEVLGEETIQQHPPFSMLKVDDPGTFLKMFAEPILGPGSGTVRDVVPCTDFQQRAILDALQDPPGRLPHWIFDLPRDVDFSKLERACKRLVEHFDILRTVFIKAAGRFWQVVLSGFKPAYDSFETDEDNVESFTNTLCKDDLKRPRQLGHSFIRFMAVKHHSGDHKLILRISHAQFDGFSFGILIENLSFIYAGHSLRLPSSFSQYMSFKEEKRRDSLQYWTSRLQASTYPIWSPGGLSRNFICDSADRLTIKQTIPMPNIQHHDCVSTATIFHAACAIALSRQFQQTEVIFGRLVTGRSMVASHLQNVVGPTMTEVPVRITIDANATLAIVASQLQTQFIEDARHEAAGMNEIIRDCTDWPDEARDFGWRTSFQQEDELDFQFLDAPSKISFYETDLPPRDRPEIYATPHGSYLDLEFEGNRKHIGEDVVRDFLVCLIGVLTEY